MKEFPKVVLKEEKSSIEKYEQFLEFIAGELCTEALRHSIIKKRNEFIDEIEKYVFSLDCKYPKTKFGWEIQVEIMNLLMRTDLYLQQFNEHDEYAKATLAAKDRDLFEKWKEFKGIKND